MTLQADMQLEKGIEWVWKKCRFKLGSSYQQDFFWSFVWLNQIIVGGVKHKVYLGHPHSAGGLHTVRVMWFSSSGGSADIREHCSRAAPFCVSARASDLSAWKQSQIDSAHMPNASLMAKGKYFESLAPSTVWRSWMWKIKYTWTFNVNSLCQ